MNYFSKKEEMSKRAQTHTLWAEKYYADKIEECVKNTVIYDCNSKFQHLSKSDIQTKVLVNMDDVVSAIFNNFVNSEKMAVLNFASYKEPGGMFFAGSKAQEECLCHASFLYNILREFEDEYYSVNRKSLNRGLYYNKALYSPNVYFFCNNKTYHCDVITCAAPNKKQHKNTVMFQI